MDVYLNTPSLYSVIHVFEMYSDYLYDKERISNDIQDVEDVDSADSQNPTEPNKDIEGEKDFVDSEIVSKKVLQQLKYPKGHHGRANVRRLLNSGFTVLDLAVILTRQYKKARARGRQHLGELLTIVYDFDNHGCAYECARLFHIKEHPGFTYGQCAYVPQYEDEFPFWRKILNYDGLTSKPIINQFRNQFNAAKWEGIVNEDEAANVLSLRSEWGLFTTLLHNGMLCIFACDDSDEDILIDEEEFMDGMPLYFTQSGYFVSPVFKVKVAEKILEYVLNEIGFPYIGIQKLVMFCNHEASLINREDYEEGGEHAHLWEGVQVVTGSDYVRHNFVRSAAQGFISSRGFFDGLGDEDDIVGTTPIEQMRITLLNAITATSVLIDAALRKELILKLTPEVLGRLCEEEEIFLPSES